MAFCSTAQDPRIRLLKSVASTGTPQRTKEYNARTLNAHREEQGSLSRSDVKLAKLGNNAQGVPAAVAYPTPAVEDGTPDAGPPTALARPAPPVGPAPVPVEHGFSCDVCAVEDTPVDQFVVDTAGTGELARADSFTRFTRRAFIGQGEYHVGWTLDAERELCSSCKARFSLRRRRHHCRACGEVFCGACSSTTAPVANLSGLHRVCATCSQQASAPKAASNADGHSTPATPTRAAAAEETPENTPSSAGSARSVVKRRLHKPPLKC